jgi:hypothetical protein
VTRIKKLTSRGPFGLPSTTRRLPAMPRLPDCREALRCGLAVDVSMVWLGRGRVRKHRLLRFSGWAHQCMPWCSRARHALVHSPLRARWAGPTVPYYNPPAARALVAPSTTNESPVFADKITLTHDQFLVVGDRTKPPQRCLYRPNPALHLSKSTCRPVPVPRYGGSNGHYMIEPSGKTVHEFAHRSSLARHRAQ